MKVNLESEYRVRVYEFRSWVKHIWFIMYVIIGVSLAFYSSLIGIGIVLSMFGILPLLRFTTRTIRIDTIDIHSVADLERYIETLPTKRIK